MKKLGARGQKILKILHLIMAGLWIGGAVTMNLMLLALGPAESGGELHGYDLALQLLDYLVIIPGAVGCLLSGLFISWLTPWGFFQHRWVALKWLLTLFCILFGTFVLGPLIDSQPPISAALGLEALRDAAYTTNHSNNITGGLITTALIISMVIISVFKPWKNKRKD